ncbi:MAG: sensor domain-containing diguanylate cyclase [Pyrinomonadaceae bacterium]
MRIAIGCSIAALSVASVAMLASWVDAGPLKGLFEAIPTMMPNTALGFAVASTGLLLFLKGGPRKATSSICGMFVGLIGSVTLAEYLTGTRIVPDGPLVTAADNSQSDQLPLVTAFNFMVLGVSLVALSGRRPVRRISEGLALLILTVAFGAALGYVYGADQLYGVTRYNGIPVHAVALFFVLAIGLIAANQSSSIVRLLTADSLGGMAARRLLPPVILIPTLIGWLRVAGQNSGLYDTGFGTAISMFTCVVLMVGIILYCSKRVHKTDRRRRAIEVELIEKEERFRELFDYSQGMMCIHDLEGRITTVNPATMRSLEYGLDEIVGRNLAEFLAPEHQAGVSTFLRTIASQGLADGILPLQAKSGRQVMWKYHCILVSQPGKEPYIIGHAQDVTELINAREQMKSLSLTDDLTGLYNRRGFLAMAEQQLKLERSDRTARGVTLMFADLDGLKKINDVYGHTAGSDAIVGVARIIKSALRDADLVARWGGDEFVILTIGSRDENADVITERIYDRINEYNAGSDKPYQIACSIGIAPLNPEDDRAFESLIAEADTAMYAEKRRRKGLATQFTPPDMAGESTARPAWP